MTEWKRYGIRRMCGQCGRAIYPGQPARVLIVCGVANRFLRCVDCSAKDGLMPPRDLPELPTPPPVVRRDVLTPVGAIARSGRDRQVGEDDE